MNKKKKYDTAVLNRKGKLARQCLRWPVFTHFLIDVFGLAAYLLADKVPLLI